jgi:hypothetical protein
MQQDYANHYTAVQQQQISIVGRNGFYGSTGE